MGNINAFQAQWEALHRQYQDFENYALLTKLFTIAIVVMALSASLKLCFLLGLVGLCWLTEAIWKTFQTRCEEELVRVEEAIERVQKDAAVEYVPLQTYRTWAQSRQGVVGLAIEYLASAKRPTVAVTYVLLLILLLLAYA